VTFTGYIAERRAKGDDLRDFGHDHYASLLIFDGKDRGVSMLHPGQNGEICGATAFWDVSHYKPGTEPEVWTLNSLDPLDISPSLLCLICQDHGFIKQGRWIPA
jgi:hypothetical protein